MRLPYLCIWVLGSLCVLYPFVGTAQIDQSNVHRQHKVIAWYCEWKGILEDSPQAFRLGEVAWAQSRSFALKQNWKKPSSVSSKIPNHYPCTRKPKAIMVKEVSHIKKMQLKRHKAPRLAHDQSISQKEIQPESGWILIAQASSKSD